MVKKTKQKEITNEFFKAIFNNNIYQLKRASENFSFENAFSYFIFEVKTSGSSGGDCYGGRASDYDIDYDERVSELSNSLQSFYRYTLQDYQEKSLDDEQFKELCNKLAEDKIYSALDSYSDYYDYYGNGTKYDLIGIDLKDFLNTIYDKDFFSQIESMFNEVKQEVSQSLHDEQQNKLLDKINKDINEFNQNKQKEEKNLIEQVERAKKMIEDAEKRLKHFEKNKDAELKKLNQKKSELEKLGYTGIKNKTSPRY